MLPKVSELIRHAPAMLRISVGRALYELNRLYMQAYWRKKGVYIESTAQLLTESPELMQLGSETYVGYYTVLGAEHTPEFKETPVLTIGERTWIGDHANIRASGGVLTIGKACLIGNDVTIISCTHGIKMDALIRDQPWIRRDVHIGDDVWIGAGVTVLPGATIGNGAVVGANAVVRGTVAPYEIVVGVPTRPVGSRENRP